MRFDVKATTYFSAAGAALSVALMVAAVRLHLEGILGDALLWGGLLLFVVCAAAGSRVALQGEDFQPPQGHRRRMIAIYGMLVSGVGFAGFAATYYWPTIKTTSEHAGSDVPAQNAPGPFKPPTFYQVFIADLPTSGGSETIVFNTQDKRTGKFYNFPVKLLLDVDSHTKFLAILIPDAPNSADICYSVLMQLQSIFSKFDETEIEISIPGDQRSVKKKDYKFSEVIYFYTEKDFPTAVQADLEQKFLDRGIATHFRGQAFYVLSWYEPTILDEIKKLAIPPNFEPVLSPAPPDPIEK